MTGSVEPARVRVEIADEAASVEEACQVMHDAYERAAVVHAWETNPASRHQDWADVPDANKATMRDAVRALLGWLEAARPSMTSRRPALDRDAVREEIRAGLNRALCNGGHPASETGWSPSDEVDRATEAVMALAVPVPTEDQIAEAIYAARQGAVGRVTDLGYAKAVLALLNGSAK